jgi:ADP-ribose pyrophosphatase YjhB (NUDIX family)
MKNASGPVGEIVTETRAFDNKFFPVIERVIKTPGGTTRDPQLVWDRRERKFVVGVVMDEHGKLLLVREPKYGQMKYLLGLPAGGVKKEEPINVAIKREVREETGYDVDQWAGAKALRLIDFADKTDGGHHHISIWVNARKVCEPEQDTEVILLGREEIDQLLDDKLPNLELEIAMSYAALSWALRQPIVQSSLR